MEWLTDLATTLHLNRERIILGVGLFLITLFGSLAVTAFILIKLPPNYFKGKRPAAFGWQTTHPLMRILLVVGKNMLGVFLVILGIILSLPGVPGQGILTILLGVMLLDFPGRRRFEIYLVSRPRVFRTINNLRQRFAKPPLELDQPVTS